MKLFIFTSPRKSLVAYGIKKKYTSCLSFDAPLCFGFVNTDTRSFVNRYRDILKGIVEKAGYDYNIDIIELEIPENHIHMLFTEYQKCPRVM